MGVGMRAIWKQGGYLQPPLAGHCAQEVDMFARKVSMHLKGSVPEFTQTLEREVLPLLRKQKGFREEMKHLASVCGTRQRTRKATTEELTPKWRRLWRR